jgi:acetylornithine deacetylase/succinyl-diaminopimelate desuccinylase-like protein
MSGQSADVLGRIAREEASYLEELKDYLRIPSVATDPAYDPEVRRCADFIEGKLKEAGLATRQVDKGGKPLVYAEWLGAPGKKTVLFYGHYDVQPADPLELWKSPPFEPALDEDGKVLVARGATDDKGQSYTHVKAVAAILAERGELPINVKFIIEGEEESGGQAIERYVREDGARELGCDAIVVSDSSMYRPGQPSLIYGLKGLCYLEIRVEGPSRDLHSGSFGGAIQNPGNALASIVASLRDPRSGKILIPGFYDRVRPLQDWERREFGALGFDGETYRAEIGVPELWGEEGYTTLERVWARPTCDVNGIFGGYQGAGAKTVLPAWAGAKVSMRLVPDQDPREIAELFRRHVEAVSPPGVKVTVELLNGAQPVLIETEGPIAEAALAAMEEIWRRPVRVREGGSIPIVASFADVLKVPILLIGFGHSDDRLHSPNEKFTIANFYGGIRAIVRMLDRLGEL